VSKLSKSPAKSDSKLKHTLETVPWAALLQVTVIIGRRWAALSSKDRARFTELVHKSHGRLRNLSVRERMELRKLAHKLDVRGMGSELVALGRGKHRRGRGRKHR
jgi:hypothetical protein